MRQNKIRRMKIVSGLASVDEYISFVEAGADEFFCGYMPISWAEKYGIINPINRREVFFYNVQIGAFEELKILHHMVKYYGVPVKLTFNSLYYLPEQYPVLLEIIEQCMGCGFDTFIIADPALMIYLRENKCLCKIHVSGELAEVNEKMIEWLKEFDIKRIIFHRKVTLEEMKACIQKEENKRNILEYEAFALNEMCHFTGAYCNSLHCDELVHLCKVPYWMEKDLRTDGAKQRECGEYQTGKTGCGLCAFWRMADAGITHLKLVGRGNYVDDMKKDIQNMYIARQILEQIWNEGGTECEYRREMKKRIFQDKCSGNCYYREV